MAMTIVEAGRTVTGGVDTHLDVHVAAALDPIGGLLGVESFVPTPAGYKALLEWMEGFGDGRQGGGGGHRRLWRGPRPVPAPARRRGDRGRPAEPPGAAHARASPIPLDAVEAARAALSGPGPGRRPSPATATSRPSGRCSWPSARPDKPGSRPSPRCAI